METENGLIFQLYEQNKTRNGNHSNKSHSVWVENEEIRVLPVNVKRVKMSMIERKERTARDDDKIRVSDFKSIK